MYSPEITALFQSWGLPLSIPKIYMSIANTNRAYMVRYLKQFNVTISEFLVLNAVNNYDTPLCHNDIARMLKVTKSFVTKTVFTLEKSGLLRSETDPANRKRKNLCLTEKGGELIPSLVEIRETWSKKIFALAPDELATFLRLLKVAYDRSEELYEELARQED